MIEPFEFATATRIIFGRGSVARLPALVAQTGSCALFICGGHPERLAPVSAALRAVGVALVPFLVSGEPTIEITREGVALARQAACELVIGIGGGSVLDAAKAIAILVTHDGNPLDYLEVIGQGKPITQPGLPFFALPTTSGTGAEVTKNAVLESRADRVKVSLRSPWMLPKVALVDSELTWSVPEGITATTGMDALTQCLEPYVSRYHNPLTDGWSLEGMRRSAHSLRRAHENGSDASARDDLALASLFGGLALANAKLGAVHGIAGPLGGMFKAPHGAVCACLLPEVMQANVEALRSRQPASDALERYREIAVLFTGRSDATAEDGISWVRELRQQLGIPGLHSYGMSAADFEELIPKAKRASSMQGNPVSLTDAELRAVLQAAL